MGPCPLRGASLGGSQRQRPGLPAEPLFDSRCHEAKRGCGHSVLVGSNLPNPVHLTSVKPTSLSLPGPQVRTFGCNRAGGSAPHAGTCTCCALSAVRGLNLSKRWPLSTPPPHAGPLQGWGAEGGGLASGCVLALWTLACGAWEGFPWRQAPGSGGQAAPGRARVWFLWRETRIR